MVECVAIWMCPKIGVPPKWMVKIMEAPIKMDDLGVPYFWKHPYIFLFGGVGVIVGETCQKKKMVISQFPLLCSRSILLALRASVCERRRRGK